MEAGPLLGWESWEHKTVPANFSCLCAAFSSSAKILSTGYIFFKHLWKKITCSEELLVLSALTAFSHVSFWDTLSLLFSRHCSSYGFQ